MVARLARRVPNPEDVLELQPEELGGVILRGLFEDGGDVHLHNFVVGLRQMDEVYPRARSPNKSRVQSARLGHASSSEPDRVDRRRLAVRHAAGNEVADTQAFADFRKPSLLPRELLYPRDAGLRYAGEPLSKPVGYLLLCNGKDLSRVRKTTK